MLRGLIGIFQKKNCLRQLKFVYLIKNKMIKKWFLVLMSLIFIDLTAQTINTLIDLSKTTKKESVAGFLHFNDLEPLQNHINQLKPKYWRFGAKLKDDPVKRKEQVDILLKNNIVPILVLSDIYDEEHWYKEKGGWIRPSDNGQPFAKMIKKLYSELGNKIVFDVWNEPNIKDVWGGTKEEYFKTFKVAHDALRSSPGGRDALITGPSISAFDIEYIDSFLDYCNKNNLTLDILNWHELGGQSNFFDFSAKIEKVKKIIHKYPKIGIKDIYIPEIVGLHEQFNPTTIISYLHMLENNGIKGGCKACWDNPDVQNENSCWNNSMDGIISPEGKPRSAWWVYKYYAESLPKRLASKSFNREIITISYIDANDDFCMLVANLGERDIIDHTILFRDIKNSILLKRNKINVYLIPNSNSEVVDKIIKLTERKISENKKEKLSKITLKAKTLYYVTTAL